MCIPFPPFGGGGPMCSLLANIFPINSMARGTPMDALREIRLIELLRRLCLCQRGSFQQPFSVWGGIALIHKFVELYSVCPVTVAEDFL